MDLIDSDFSDEQGPDESGTELCVFRSCAEIFAAFKPRFWEAGADLDALIQIGKAEPVIRTAITEDGDGNSVIELGQLVPMISEELSMVFECILETYAGKFAGLESIVPERRQYVEVVKVLQFGDMASLAETLNGVLSKEQILVVSMALKTDYNPHGTLDESLLESALRWFDLLHSLLVDVERFVEDRIKKVAPNLCSMIGAYVATRLVAHCGSVKDLSAVPSCNLASIGRDKAQGSIDASGVRQRGYLFHSDLVQMQPFDFQKQALRMVCAKVSLCARADCALENKNINVASSAAGAMGLKWRQEVLEKLKKIEDPPNVGNVKPLPVPEDAPKKKRAGRRFRKYKEQFKMSHLRQMQNRMEFGKEEQSTMDAYGEEIGMGMASSKNVRALSSGFNNKTKMRKEMRHRLANEKKNTQQFFMDDRSESLKRSTDSLQTSEPNKRRHI